MKNLIFILLIAFGLFLALFFYRKYALTQTELTLANQRILDRDRLIYNNQKRLDTLKSNNASTSRSSEKSIASSNLSALSTDDLTRLQEKGLTSPETNLREDLISKQNMLLPKGSLGGTMAIQQVKVLNDRYVLAYFEDGHNGGYLLLRFSIEPDKRINWKVLDYYRL
ncbi:hypothetical protein AHMF7605_23960 [Adhaeribacter arboris]|uniref:Uncharacterized protein n=1 Tax=Adhaeribacter arboris TaxID=2072846 RepID=A0A2T2YLD5_9BACT|nr:hypothetical protein [Adhaeribacter arboris]PSR56333.1 hypothetical protein AHMF7605_23960 [Adhaeribacter arboris]